jgi:spoIIIJ-associated protein
MAHEGDVFEGKTLDAAVRNGLEALRLSRAEVMITIIEEGTGGFLGIGSRPYRVRVMRRPGGPPAVESEAGARRRRGAGRERRGERREERRAETRRPAAGDAGRRGERRPPRREERLRERRERRETRRGEAREESAAALEAPGPDLESAERVEPEGASDLRRRRRRGRRGGRKRRPGAPEGGQEVAYAPDESAAEPVAEYEETPVSAEAVEGEEREEGYEPAERPRRGRPRGPRREPRGEMRPGTARPPSLSAEELASQSKQLTENLLEAMGFEAKVSATADGNHVEVTAEVAEDEDLLTGRKGEVRQALQHLLNRMLNRGESSRYHLQLEINDFWKRREEELRELARSLAGEAVRTGGEMETEYLNAQERRIVHVTLREDTRVKTYALGTGMIKRVAVAPADFEGGPRDESG